MSNVSVSSGYVSIVEIDIEGNKKAEMEEMKNALLDLVNSPEIQESPFVNYIFLNLQPFHIINSTLIGAIGSAIMDDKVQMIGLCGVQPTVLELLQRFGVTSNDNIPKDFSSRKIQDNFDKTIIFDSVRDGLASLA